MSLEQFKNNSITTLGSEVSSVTTTITLATGSGNSFPAISGGQFFTGTMIAAGSTTGTPNEIVKVTARVGDTLTVLRGQEGTAAASWSVGDIFAGLPTAGFFNDVILESDVQLQAGNSAVDTGAANQAIIVLAPAIGSLGSIMYAPIRILKEANPNTGAYTIIVNGLPAKPLLLNGQPMAAGQLAASEIFEVVWDGANFELMSVPASIANGNLALMAAGTVKANLTNSAAAPQDVTTSELLAALGIGGGAINTNGYIVVPVLIGGAVINVFVQWMAVNGTVGSDQTYNFAEPFPTACLFCNGTYKDTTSTGNGGSILDASYINRTQFRTQWIDVYNSGGRGDAALVKIIAFGY